jgi:hypothetical protein
MAVAGIKPGVRGEVLVFVGVVLASFLIPLVLEGRWSVPVLALGGAVVFWAGVVQKRMLVRHLGLLLQLAAGFIFVDSVWYPFFAAPFANYYFLGCFCLALAALSSSYFLDRYSDRLQKWEKYYPMPVMILGLVWWYIGGLREVDRQVAHLEVTNGFLMFICASSIVMGMVLKKLDWPRFRASMYLQLPALILLATRDLSISFSGSFLFVGWGAVAWTVAMVIQYRILSLYAGDWPRKLMYGWYLGTILLLVGILWRETVWFWHHANTLEKWPFWAVLVSWAGLLFFLVRNLIKEMRIGGEKRVSEER